MGSQATPRVDAAIREEIESVDGLLNLLSVPAFTPPPRVGLATPRAAGAQGSLSHQAALADHTPATHALHACYTEHALRSQCMELEASFSESREQVHTLSKKQLKLEHALEGARDEVGCLRAAHAALEARAACHQHQEGALRQQALGWQLEVQRCREEISGRDAAHAREIGEMRQEFLDLRVRMAAMRCEFVDGERALDPRNRINEASISHLAGTNDIEEAVLHICDLFDDSINSLPELSRFARGWTDPDLLPHSSCSQSGMGTQASFDMGFASSVPPTPPWSVGLHARTSSV